METTTQAATHTPGPWATGYDGRSVYGPDRDLGYGVTTHVLVRCNAAGIKSAENAANARLIAAAPALLDNLKQLSRLLEQYISGDLITFPVSARFTAREAIKLAEGGA